MLYETEGWERGKVRKQSRESLRQHGRWPQVTSTRQIATELSLIPPEKKKQKLRNIVGWWAPSPPPNPTPSNLYRHSQPLRMLMHRNSMTQ